MHSVVNARITDQAGRGQHKPQTATKVNCHYHRGREPICGVRRGHAERTALADQTVDIGQGQKWARSRDDFLDEPADPSVAESDGQREHQNAGDSSRATFPDENKTDYDQGWKKKGIAAEKRHDFVEKRITSGLINEAKSIDVQFQQPIHQENNLIIKG